MEKRYFTSPFLKLKGVDGIGQVWNDSQLVALTFPDRFSANRHPDVQLTFHEMGHFVTLRECRVVRDAFGFNGGIPDLGWDPSNRIHERPASFDVEAKAFAWEYLLMKDVFGVELELSDLVRALRFATDFDTYPGADEKEKCRGAELATATYIEKFVVGPDFDTLWNERVQKLPQLFAAESKRCALLGEAPVAVEHLGTVAERWEARLSDFGGGAGPWTIDLSCQELGMAVSEAFDSRDAAKSWFDRVQNAYRPEEEMGMKP